MRRVIHAALTAFLLIGGFYLAYLEISGRQRIEGDTVITSAFLLLLGSYLGFEDFVAPALASWKETDQGLRRDLSHG